MTMEEFARMSRYEQEEYLNRQREAYSRAGAGLRANDVSRQGRVLMYDEESGNSKIIKELQERLVAAQEIIQAQQDEIWSLSKKSDKEVEQLEHKKASLEQAIRLLENQHASTRNVLEKVTKDTKDKQRQARELEGSARSFQDILHEIEHWKQNKLELKSEITSLLQRRHNLMEEIKNLIRDIEDIDSVTELSAQITKLKELKEQAILDYIDKQRMLADLQESDFVPTSLEIPKSRSFIDRLWN